LLGRWASGQKEAPALNLIFLHGLNPFGFAWLRRFDEQNVDPNRNFLLSGEKFEGSPEGYAGLDMLLNPAKPPSQWEPFILKALWAIVRNGGMSKIKQVVAAGQYDYPKGLFYGGAEPSHTQRVLAENLKRWIGDSARIVHLDFHTGLGKRRTWKLLIDSTLTDAQERRLGEWFGPDNFEKSNSRGVAYKTSGSLGNWCVEMNERTDYLYACAEFGTYSPIKVISSLRAENQAHNWGKRDDIGTIRAKRDLMEAFCPRASKWREAALNDSYRIVDSAAQGLEGIKV
jgi:hypothetical protein